MKTYMLDAFWQLEIDENDPSGMRIRRTDGKFYEVVFNTQKYGLPLIVEQTDANGVAGRVLPIVRKSRMQWQVAVTFNSRPANDYREPLMEGSRASVSNDDPFLSTDGHRVFELGRNFANSARIAGEVLFGVIDVTDDSDFTLPEGARWVAFGEFSRKSTDALVKAALFDFMMQRPRTKRIPKTG